MTENELKTRYREEMTAITVSSRLKQDTMNRICEKEKPVMKRKISVALAFALVAMLGAVALAANLGVLDFAGRYGNAYVPEDAQSYVQSDVLTLESDLVTARLSELYYDGLVVRMTVDVKPKSEKIMLLGEDVCMEDPFINMTPMDIEFDKTYTETVRDVYESGGYERAYSVSSMLYVGGDEWLSGSGDHQLQEDGTLTLYQQWEYREAKPQREAKFQLTLFPYADTLDRIDVDGRIDLEKAITLTAAEYEEKTYQSTAPVDFPSVGVQVDKLTLEVRAQEIHASLEITVTDEEKYAALDDGLWFEFIDPDSVETEPYNQRLREGLTGGGSIGPVIQGELHFRQTQTLGRNELHGTYTLRAYSAWTKERFETKTIDVELVK